MLALLTVRKNETMTLKINQLCLTRVARNSVATDKPVALEFPIELEFRSVGFCGGKKTEETRRKTLGARTRTNNKLSPHMTPSPRIEPGPHWWEASALTTAPSLLPTLSWSLAICPR